MRAISKMLELHSYLSLTADQREQRRKDVEFKKWAAKIKPGWVPKLDQMGATFKK